MKVPRKNLPPADTLVAATLFLMTKHAAIRCPVVGRVIARQLQFLAEHPSETMAPHLRAVCAKLAEQWTSDADEDERKRTQSLLERNAGSISIH